MGAFALIVVLFCAGRLVLSELVGPSEVYAGVKGDLDHDGDIDLDDLEIFSWKWLDKDWREVDWCQWIADNHKIRKHLKGLYDFILDQFGCDEPPEPPVDPLEVRNANNYPVRLAWGLDRRLYVTDPRVGSVFIYDANIAVIGELKGLSGPLGIALDALDNIYVGNDGRDNVEVYSPWGDKIATIGDGTIKMPNDLAFDRASNLYVVASRNNLVHVFDIDGNPLGAIGEGELSFPTAIEIAYYIDETGQEIGEVYVADQGHFLIKVFGLDGELLRSFGGEVFEQWSGMMGKKWVWQGKFVKVQSLIMDDLGRLHVLDSYIDKVQILNPETGAYLGYYGEKGSELGQLKVALDIAINEIGEVAVANYRNKRVEVIFTVVSP